MARETISRSKQWYRDHWNVAVQQGTINFAPLALTGSTNGSSNPSWRQQVKRGLNATTTFTGTQQYAEGQDSGSIHFVADNYSCAGFYLGRSVGSESGNLCSFLAMPNDPINLGISDADREARIYFFKRLREIRTSFQSGVFLGELAETLRMIRRPGKALRDSFKSYSQTAKKRAAKEKSVRSKNHAVAGTYLEYSFGWKPLAHEVDDLATTLANIGFRRDSVTVRSHGEWARTLVGGAVHAGESDLTDYVYGSYLNEYVGVRYVGAVNNEASASRREWQRWGLTTDNFVPTIYNLIPHSFLVDYFSNLGDIIDAVSIRNVVLGWHCRTFETKRERVISYLRGEQTVTSCPSGTVDMVVLTNTASQPNFKLGWRRVHRSIAEDPYVNALDFRLRIPGVDDPWKWLNIAGLAALRR